MIGQIICASTALYCVKKILEPDDIAKEFYSVFHSLGIAEGGVPFVYRPNTAYVKYGGYCSSKRYITFRFKVSRNLPFSTMENKLEDIKHALNVNNLELEWKNNYLYFTVRYAKTDIVKFRMIDSEPTMIPLGFDEDDQIVYWDVLKDSHALIGGATNCGKSTLIRSIIFFLAHLGVCDIMLADLKEGLEFNRLQHLRGVVGYAEDVPTTIQMINTYYSIAINRMKMIREAGCLNFEEYNATHDEKLKRMFLIIDEFAELIPRRKSKDDQDVIDNLINLARRCRAAGMHIILSTQRPSKDVVDGSLKNNFTAIIGLRTNNQVNSKVIIDEKGLEELNVGEAKAILCGRDVKFYTMLLEGKELKGMIKKYSVPPAETDKEKQLIKDQLLLTEESETLIDVDEVLQSFYIK